MSRPEPPGERDRLVLTPDSEPALIRLALEEDLSEAGDVTSRLTVPEGVMASARLVAREPGVLAGIGVFERVFRIVDRATRVDPKRKNGDRLERGDVVAVIEGPARGLLTAERTALNFLQRLSGIASLTRRFVDKLDGTGVRLLDTRKTTPGWRSLEKAAVRAGGGHNHRHGLHDMILIKDNHIVAAGGIKPALQAALNGRPPGITVEIEVARLEDLEAALSGHPDAILLDNMGTDEIKNAVAIVRRRTPAPWIEVSGGVTLENIRDRALPGVDFISSGSLTHSAPALDLALDFTGARPAGTAA